MVSGSFDRGWQTGHKGDAATIFSNVFKGAPKHNFAGVLSVSLSNSKTSALSIRVTLSTKLKAGTYSVGGRCGGGNFGSAKLKVTKAGASPSPPGFYSLKRSMCIPNLMESALPDFNVTGLRGEFLLEAATTEAVIIEPGCDCMREDGSSDALNAAPHLSFFVSLRFRLGGR